MPKTLNLPDDALPVIEFLRSHGRGDFVTVVESLTVKAMIGEPMREPRWVRKLLRELGVKSDEDVVRDIYSRDQLAGRNPNSIVVDELVGFPVVSEPSLPPDTAKWVGFASPRPRVTTEPPPREPWKPETLL